MVMAELPDYYEVLGVPRGASPAEIGRAYDHWVEEFRKDATPPDPARESLLREAREVLSDGQRRASYDAQLAATLAAAADKRAKRKPAKGHNAILAYGAAAVVAAAIVGIFLALRPKSNEPLKADRLEELRRALPGSVSSLVTYDISGKSAPAGLGWVIADGLMVANCGRSPAGVQLMVSQGTKQVPARVMQVDEALGLCQLATDGYVGEPLAVGAVLPALGARVYGTALGARGEVGMREAKITGVVADAPGGAALRASVEPQPGGQGAPLIDAQGKVVAVAVLQPDGGTLYRAVPAGWATKR